jgi:hypothetical protein
MERTFWVLAVALILPVLTFGFLRFLDRRFAKDAKEARDHLLKTGLRVERVQREVPYFTSNFELRREVVTSYCLRHAATKASRWSLLQRETRDGAKFPHGWKLVVEHGKISQESDKALIEIDKEYEEGYLDFEFYPDNLCAFWNEWGGVKQAERVRSYLERISSASVVPPI